MCVCVCVRRREGERERETARTGNDLSLWCRCFQGLCAALSFDTVKVLLFSGHKLIILFFFKFSYKGKGLCMCKASSESSSALVCLLYFWNQTNLFAPKL